MVIDAFTGRLADSPLCSTVVVNTYPFSGDMGDPISVVIHQTKSKKDRR